MSNHELLWCIMALLFYVATILTVIMLNVATKP